ncbi:MAG: hypothetical protein LBU34_02440 [Planctomycetaceae bacterium]|jgi:hypothetical protein|nr:hypothetical protein [Planctomycetaceae bacterium]
MESITATNNGTVRITGNVRKLHLDGNGVVVSILHNNKELWKNNYVIRRLFLLTTEYTNYTQIEELVNY